MSLDRQTAGPVRNDPFNPDLSLLPDELRLLVEAELAPTERIQWIGQPRARRQIWEWLLLPLTGLPLTALSATIVALSETTFSRLFAFPFLLGGLALLSTPWWAVRRAKRTLYVLSDQRALILCAESKLAVQSFMPAGLQQIRCRQSRGGYGSLVFRRGQVMSDFSESPVTQVQGFLSIPDVRRVETLVRRLAKTLSPMDRSQARELGL